MILSRKFLNLNILIVIVGLVLMVAAAFLFLPRNTILVQRGDKRDSQVATQEIDKSANEANNTFSHNFGNVFLNDGDALYHSFSFTNTNEGDLKLLEVVNNKPCCGSIEFSPTTLKPNQSATIGVKLKSNNESASLSHSFTLITDKKQKTPIEFFSFAKVLPVIKIEQVYNNDKSQLMDYKKKIKIFSYGSSSSKPVDLERLQINANVKNARCGAQSQQLLSDGVIENTLELELDCSNSSQNTQKVQITLERDGKSLYKYEFTILFPKLIAATPAALIFRSSSDHEEKELQLKSIDNQEFKILEISCTSTTLQITEQSYQGNGIWRIKVKHDIMEIQQIKDVNQVIIHTDHLKGNEIKVPVLFVK